MGRLAPWVKYNKEWQEILVQRKERGALAGKPDHDSKLIPGPEPEIEQRYKWMPRQLSANLGLSMVKTYSDQSQSPLFKLPTELRLAIWEYVVGGNEVTVLRKVNKLVHVILPRDKGKVDEVTLSGGLLERLGYEIRIEARRVIAEINLLAMLQSCKRLYLEALPVLYGCNSFRFLTMEAFYRFLLYSPTNGLQSIRSIDIRWAGFFYWARFDRQGFNLEHNESWQDICDAIIAMKNLRDLSFYSWPAFELGHLQPWSASGENMNRRIVAPLDGLSEHVNFTFSPLPPPGTYSIRDSTDD